MSWISTGELPDADEVQRLLEDAYRSLLPLEDGAVAAYIPALATTPSMRPKRAAVASTQRAPASRSRAS